MKKSIAIGLILAVFLSASPQSAEAWVWVAGKVVKSVLMPDRHNDKKDDDDDDDYRNESPFPDPPQDREENDTEFLWGLFADDEEDD